MRSSSETASGGKSAIYGILVLLIAGGAFCAVFLLAEFAFRSARPRYDVPFPGYARYVLEANGPFFERKRIGDEEFLVQRARHPFNCTLHQTFPLKKPAGKKRIAVVGESSASLLGESMVECVRECGAEGRIEILNMATGGSGLTYLERRFEEALEDEPDAIVVLFGNNLLNPDAMIRSRRDLWRFRAGALIERSRLLSYAALELAGPLERRNYPNGTLDARLKMFDAFLRRAARECGSRGIRLALCTLPVHLGFPPQMIEDNWNDERFLEIRYLETIGRKAEAVRRLRELSRKSYEYAFWHHWLGEDLRRMGDYREAQRELALGVEGFLFALNATVRKAAVEEKAVLLDFEKEVAQASDHGIPGWAEFRDCQHPGVLTCMGEAEDGLQKLLGILGADSRVAFVRPYDVDIDSNPWDGYEDSTSFIAQESLQAREVRVSWAESFLSRTPVSSAEVLKSAPSERRSRAAYLLDMAEGFRRIGRLREALELNREVLKLDPDCEEAYLQRGLIFLQQGSSREAGEAFRKALSIRPDPAALFFLRKLELDGGRKKAA